MPEMNFSPAKVHATAKDFYIDWYNYSLPASEQRQRVRLNRIDRSARDAFAKNLCSEIDKYLLLGEDPWQRIAFLKRNKSKYSDKPDIINKITLKKGFDDHCSYILKSTPRKDTHRSYKSIMSLFVKWMLLNYPEINTADKLTHLHAIKYFDYLLHDRNYVPKSYNNNLTTLRGWFEKYFIKRKAATENVFRAVDTIKLKRKYKTNKLKFTPAQLQLFKNVLSKEDPYFWMVCCSDFFCFIRPTEITRLHISNFDFKNGFIEIFPDEAKDWHYRKMKVPDEFLSMILQLKIDTFNKDLYFISKDNFAPGSKRCTYQDIERRAKYWFNKLSFPEGLTFYDFKRSGIYYFREHGGDREAAKEQAGHGSDLMHYIYYQPSDKIKEQFKTFSIDDL